MTGHTYLVSPECLLSEVQSLFNQCMVKAAKCNPYVRVRIQTHSQSLDKSFINELSLNLENFIMGLLATTVMDCLANSEVRDPAVNQAVRSNGHTVRLEDPTLKAGISLCMINE